MDLKTIGGTLGRHLLTLAAGALASGGILQQGHADYFVGAGMFLLGILWSLWDKYGRRYVAARLAELNARLEIVTAAAEARAERLTKNHIKAPTMQEIADKIPDPNVTAAVVLHTMHTKA